MAPSRHQHWSPRLDGIGAVASFVCALHCALLPLAVATLPYSGLESLDSPAFDRAFAAFAIAFGLVVIGTGACRQRLRVVATLFATGVVLLAVGVLPLGAWHHAPLALGGAAIAAAHLVNRHGVRHHGSRAVNLWVTAFSSRRAPADVAADSLR